MYTAGEWTGTAVDVLRGGGASVGKSLLGSVDNIGSHFADDAGRGLYRGFTGRTGGRLGSDATRAKNATIATELEQRGWTVTGGGGRVKEEYLPALDGGRKGSNYVDITATKGGRTLRINTVDTMADGVTPTSREATAAARIREKTAGDHLLLIPK